MENARKSIEGLDFRTTPYAHQLQAFELGKDEIGFAQLGEQGTGKTWTLIQDACYLYVTKKIDAALVLAPKGVDANWLNDELVKHMPTNVKYFAALWRAHPRKKQRVALGKISGHKIDFSFQKEETLGMKWLLMNWDAISTQKGFTFAMEFLEKNRCIIIADEAQKVKSPESARSKALLKMGKSSGFRRIATGTPITNSPFDMFVPFSFLDPKILGTQSFVAFKAEYSKTIGPSSPLYWSILMKMAAKKGIKDPEVARQMFGRRMPQIIEKDEADRPIYKNLDKLQALVKKHSFRILKSECLDLPDKIFQKRYFDLTESQRKIYEEARDKFRVILEDDSIQTLTALTALQKLSQITSGFYIETAENIIHEIPGENPKLETLKDVLEDMDGQAIIWANFTAEFEHITRACEGRSVVEYHGGISDRDRSLAVEKFQSGRADVFIGHPKSGGTGLTLHAASNVIYYSNSYSLEARLQSEDRAHRIGQKKNVLYTDLVASNTIEEKIIQALQDKADLAALINGDLLRESEEI